MKVVATPLPGVLVLEPDVFFDHRGYFFEAYNQEAMARLGITAEFVQDNESRSKKGVLRGLHFQVPPFAQGKLVRVVFGEVLDVAVDLRKHSPTFGRWVSQVLSEQNKLLLWIPEGFAHGFITLSDEAVFTYKCTALYHKASERTIRFDDPVLAIEWGNSHPIVAEKDLEAPLFSQTENPF